MKWIKCLFLTFFSYSFCNAQSYTITGVVLTNEGKSLPVATVTLHKKAVTAILSFAISNKDGRFEINYNTSNKDSLELKASLLGFGNQSIFFISGKPLVFQFILSPQAIMLPEVKAVSRPIWQRKDTIDYDATAFKQQQDRVIGDIIARLPGIEVTSTGQIKYQGKPINKYYIEGLDLLEDRYSIANNNIPADAVDKVQVIENHQPIRLLDSVFFSDRAALNIKLKNNSKARLIGQVRLGAGITPLLAENELVTMLFNKKTQSINTYKYNNTGTDNARELTAHNLSHYFNALQSGAMKADLLSVIEPGEPTIIKNRYLFNDAHTVSSNQLFPLDSVYQLRINSSYINDYQKFKGSISNRIFLPYDTVDFLEQNNIYKGVNLFQTDITLMANSSKYYLKNILHFQGWLQQDKGVLLSNTNNTEQKMNMRLYNIFNDFKVIKIRKRNILEWGSYLGYSTQPQRLFIYPGIYKEFLNNNNPYDAALQKAHVNVFYTDNHFSIRRRLGKLNTSVKFGANWQHKIFNSQLYTETAGVLKTAADSFLNNLKWDRLSIYTEVALGYESNSFLISGRLPVAFTSIDYLNIGNSLTRRRGVVVNPILSITLQLSSKWGLGNNITYTNRNFGEADQVANGYLLKSYRNFSNNRSSLPEQSNYEVSSYINFKDPLKNIFFTTGISYSDYSANIIYEQNFDGILETLLARLFDNSSQTLSFFSRLNKYVLNWKTSFSANVNYSLSKAQQLQQDVLIRFINKRVTTGININTKINNKLTAAYNINGYMYITATDRWGGRKPIYSASQEFSLNYFPSLPWGIRLSGDHYYLSAVGREENYYFADLNIRLKPVKSKIDWELLMQNLFNTRQFISVVNTNNTEIISTYNLRPRQLLLKAGFRL